jgi:hypothetical protein
MSAKNTKSQKKIKKKTRTPNYLLFSSAVNTLHIGHQKGDFFWEIRDEKKNVKDVVKSKKIIRQDKEIVICKTSSSGTMYDSSLLLCVLQTSQCSLL